MNTKEAIELTKINCFGTPDLKKEKIRDIITYYGGIVKLLKRGEKYEKMWNELYDEINYLDRGEDVLDYMETFEQKYHLSRKGINMKHKNTKPIPKAQQSDDTIIWFILGLISLSGLGYLIWTVMK